MREVNLTEQKKKAKTFCEYNTYVFIQTNTTLYNGYILSVHDDIFMFIDDKITNPFPIRFDTLKAPIEPSKKRGKDFNFGRTNGY